MHDFCWRDIESAPKDGSRVLLWNRHFDAPCSGQFYGFGDWRMDGNLPPFGYQPSHWMPLPAAPGTRASVAPGDAPYLQALADKVVIMNATGDPDLFLAAVKDLLAEVRTFSPAPAAGDALDVLLLTEALQGLRQAFVIAVGDKSPFAKLALEKADAALAAQVPQQGEA